ncbi:unnamed protein product, partial [Medioppia subpectinata]
MCVALMGVHLRKLYKDIVKSNLEAIRVSSLVTAMMTVQTGDREQEEQRNFYSYVQRLEHEGVSRVKMFVVILVAYLLFWGPLYTITLAQPGLETSLTYEISLHVALTHCFVNPILFMVYSRGHTDPDDPRYQRNNGCCCRRCLSAICCCCCRLLGCADTDSSTTSGTDRRTPSPSPPSFIGHNNIASPSPSSAIGGHHRQRPSAPPPPPMQMMPFYSTGNHVGGGGDGHGRP